jgi:hypothetical protein
MTSESWCHFLFGAPMKKLTLLLLIILMTPACAGWRLAAPGTALKASSPSDRCYSLSDRAAVFAGVAAGAGALAGASGLSTVAFDDKGAQAAMAITSLVLGAAATGATLLSQKSSSQWADEGCGK